MNFKIDVYYKSIYNKDCKVIPQIKILMCDMKWNNCKISQMTTVKCVKIHCKQTALTDLRDLLYFTFDNGRVIKREAACLNIQNE